MLSASTSKNISTVHISTWTQSLPISAEGTTRVTPSVTPPVTTLVGTTRVTPSVTPPVTTLSLNLTTSSPEVTTTEFTATSTTTTTSGGICKYTDWTQWTECSKSCDVGQMLRSRDLVMESWDMCTLCNDTTKELEDCNAHACVEWSPWGEWSDCTASGNCTAGVRTRYRTCTGATCEGDAVDMERCGEWCDETDATCPPGKIWVSCEDLESSSGKVNCKEFSFYESVLQGENCEGGACVCGPNNYTSDSGDCVAASACPCYTENGTKVLPGESITVNCDVCFCNSKFEWSQGINIPVLECSTNASCCDWSEWTPWGSCNVSCGTGSRHRYRDLLNGENCGPNVDVDDCSEECSPDCVVNGTGYSCGDVISDNSTHTCYCTTGNGTECIEKIPEIGECQKYTRTEFLYDQASNCTSKGYVPVDFCSGSCGNSTFQGILVFDQSDMNRQLSNCDCCTGTFQDTMYEVTLTCGPNNEERTGYIPRISKCSCSPCSSATSVTLPATQRFTPPLDI